MYTTKYEKQELVLNQKNDAKKEMQTNLSGIICSYAFLEDSLSTGNQAGASFVTILGTTEGQLYLMNKNFELRGPLETSPTRDLEIWCINPVFRGKGFMIAGNSTKFLMYEENGKDMKNPYIKADRYIQNKAFDNINVNAICQPSEDYLVAGLKDGRIIKVKLSSERSGGANGYEFSSLIYPFHNATINDMDIAVMKPLIATCSSDKSVKVWNYESKVLETEKVFEEEAKMISFHPSGFHLAVVFNNKIRLLNILMSGKGLESYHDLNDKQCTAIAFSNGGQYFAVAKNTTVHIYSSYTGENLSHLTLKDDNSIITKILWQQDDFKLYTSSREGHIIEWNFDIDKSEKLTVSKIPVLNNQSIANCFDFTSYSNKDQEENCLVVNTIERHIITVKLKKDDPRAREKEGALETKKPPTFTPVIRETGSRISAVKFASNNNLLILGTGQLGISQPGVLRFYKYPLTGQVSEIQIHQRAITKILVNKTDSMAFTIGEDNIISMIRLNWSDKDNSSNRPLFSEEYLYNKLEYTIQLDEISKMSQKLKETQERTKRFNESVKQQKMKEEVELNRKKEEEKRQGEFKIGELHKQVSAMEREYDEKMAQLKADNDRMIKEMEKANDERIEGETQKYENKNKLKEEAEKRFLQDFLKLERMQAEEKAKRMEEYDLRVREEQEERNKLLQRKIEIKEQHEKSIRDIESKADKTIDKLRREFDLTLKILESECEKQSNNLKKAIHECSDEENNNLKSEETLKNLSKEINDITLLITQAKNNKRNLETDIEEREETIRKKNDRIKELERKTQELEKFKFVLKYKIGELRRDIGPREQDIAKMKEQLEVMRSETKEYLRENGHLILFVNEFELKLKGIKNQFIDQDKKINEYQAYVSAYECELTELCGLADKGDEKEVKKKLIEIYNKYTNNDKKLTDMSVDAQQRLIKKRYC